MDAGSSARAQSARGRAGTPDLAALEAGLPEAPASAPLTVDDFEALAREKLPKLVYDYYAGGAGDEWTLRENRRAFERWVLRPRILVDVSAVDLSSTVLGQPVPFPVLLAPTALQGMAYPEGEVATARGAARFGALMVASMISTVPLEAIAATEVARWFQLYVLKDRDLTAEIVRRADAAGYRALAVSVDAPMLGRRLRDERNRFTLPPGIGLANLEVPALPDADGSALFAFFVQNHEAALTWDDVHWIRSLSPMPVVLKGVMTAEDTRLAVEAGVDGVIVSNHGGRQLDGAAGSLDVLPEVVEAAEGRVEVMLDGGVRRGSDVLKALALGAHAVLVGRPYLWGLAVDGEAGVQRVLEVLRDELALALALAGRASVADVDRSMVAPAPSAPR